MFVFLVQEQQCCQEAGTSDAVVNIELQLKSMSVSSKNLGDKAEEIFVRNCKSSEDASNYALSMISSTESTTFKKVLLLRFEIDSDFPQLSQVDLRELSEKYTGRDVVIILHGNKASKSSIYWRGKEFKNFVALQPFCDEPTEEHQKLYQFIVDFLVQCLSNDQYGMNN
jgi:hypothetical protein